MFSRTIWCLVILSASNRCILGKHVHFKDDSRTNTAENVKRLKRGIVLVDEDFDVPSGAFGAKEYGGIFSDPVSENSLEGSGHGTSELWTNELEKPSITLYDAESEYDIINETTIAEQKESEYIKVTDKTTYSEHFENESESSNVATKSTAAETLKNVSDPTNFKFTEKTVDKSDTAYSISVSSGDGMPTEFSSTEEIPITMDNEYEEVSDDCWNSTCDVSDLSVELSENTNLIPEGTNLTLTCRANVSDHQMLYWYQSNGTTYFLQTFGKIQELTLRVPDSRIFHSGKYKCMRKVDRATCCNIEIHLTVYKVPLYRYHLIILSLIAAVGLLLCIFLGVRQSRTLKVYTKGFIQKHGDKNQQLLWN